MSGALGTAPSPPAERGERAAALGRWPDRSVPEALADVVARHGARTAIVTPEGDLTYRELAARVGRVAAVLRSSAGAAPRHVVLLFDHGALAVIAMLGALSAGETYVMLDPGDPQERLELILGDSLTGAGGLLLTHGRRRAQAERLARGRCPVVDVDALDADADADADAGRRAGLPATGGATDRVPPDRPAYLIYTSGSTGVPKGVVQTHRSLLFFIGCFVERLRVSESDRITLLFTLSFSASNMDIYGALMTGAALCPYDVHERGGADLARWVDASGITLLHAAPSLFRSMLAASPEPARLSKVRAIDLGGEAVHAGDVRLWRARFAPDSVLVNHLGATESSVIGMHTVPREADAGSAVVASGTQPPGVTLRIVRPDGSECATGEVGEILVSSPFVSPGYWNRPDLTAAAFSSDPAREGWRIYRTGDLGRVDGDGLLWRIGRADDRVKIRGHSVDLSEVEAALRHACGTDEAAVVAVEGPRGDGVILAAYAARATGTAAEARRAMAARVPSYMVPAEVHLLERLPRAATGKVDRKLLSGPDRPRVEERRDTTPPEGDAERAVAAVMRRVLGLEVVGRDEPFFDLGGTSLTAAELQAGVREALGAEITPAMLIGDSTVRGIAAVADAARRLDAVAERSVLLPLRATGSRPPLFLVHGRQLQAFLSPEFTRVLGDDQPLYVFQGRTGKGAPARIGPMVVEYLAAVRAVQPKGPYFLGGLCLGAYVAHEMACRLQDAGEAVAPLLLIDPPPSRARPRSIVGRLKRLRRLWWLYRARLRVRLGLAEKRVAWERAMLERKAAERKGRHAGASASDVALASLSFQIAREHHWPRAYTGAVRVVGSAALYGERGEESWRPYVSGDLRLDIVGGTHEEVLDPGNPEFVAAVRRVQEEAARM